MAEEALLNMLQLDAGLLNILHESLTCYRSYKVLLTEDAASTSS